VPSEAPAFELPSGRTFRTLHSEPPDASGGGLRCCTPPLRRTPRATLSSRTGHLRPVACEASCPCGCGHA